MANENRSPAYQRYPADILANRHMSAMTNEEWGAYDRLCLHIWREGSLPFDEEELAKILKITTKKFRRLWLAMEKIFHLEDDEITSPELDEQRRRQAEWRRKSAEGGRKSAASRRKGGVKGGSTTVQPNSNTSSSSSSSSSFSSSSPHTRDATSQRDVAANGRGVGVSSQSKFTDEERHQYALFHHGEIHTPSAWVAAGRDSRFDIGIEDWVSSNKEELIKLGTFAHYFEYYGGDE